MKIKRLSMLGFKSFMDRIEVSFPTGISAVVGPNGCGKSNIVDAIRWAMGEQSVKQLRGRQMEDVIFSGAGEFKPMGMAEVSVVFENSDGHFPSEFAQDSEISITRRLYRSGESEYLLNNVPCRLKDVQEIFMDTGLGNRAYSIIGQGKIGTIIEQRPEETRILLEEAAGITKYKKKVEESQRRLERTKQNLEQLEHILLEVERQMRSLKRQASKARRFKSIGQEIQRLELLLHANSYHELKEESSNRNKSTEELIQREVGLSTELSRIQARIETMSLELEEKDNEVSSMRDKYLDLKEQFNEKKSLLQSLESEKRMQGDLEKRLKQERDDTGRRITVLEEERAGLGDEVEKLKQQAAELEDEIGLLNKRLMSRKQLLNEAKDEHERARVKVNAGMTKEVGLNQESGYLTKRIGEITDSRTRLENEQRDVRTKIENFTNASLRKSETRQALSQKLKAIEEEIFAEQKRCEELDQIKKGIETDLNATEADLNLDQSRLSSLQSLTENFEGYKIGVRTIMKAHDLKARSEGRIIGLVADIIDVEPEHEQAVEAVLADKLQYIIVESQRDGKEAIDYLKIKARGRSSFVPLMDLTRGKSLGNGNGHPLLKDLVSVEDSYRPLVEILLGDAALVKNLDEAISSWRNNGRDLCLVTPEGDMVDQRGIISGGRLAHSSHGLLARKREIKGLEEKIERSKRKVEEFKTSLEDRKREIEEKTSSLNDLIEEKSECQEKINDLDKAIFRLSHELDQLQRLSDRNSHELEQKGKEQAKHAEALKRIEEELRSYGETKRVQEEYLRLKEAELKESEEEFDQIRNELEKQRMGLNISREEVKGLLREKQRIGEFIEDSQQKLKRTEQDILDGQARFQESLKRGGVLQEELKDFYVILEKAEGAVRAAEQERSHFQSRIREEDKRVEGVRGDLEELRETINRAKLQQSEIRIKMENLMEMVKEKHNLDLPEIYKEYLEADFAPIETRERLEHQRKLRERLGDVNLTAIQEYEALKERHTFMTGQKEDLINSIESINQAIRKINRTSRERFLKTLEEVDKKLRHVFPILFNGGTAGLRLVDETKPLESGVLVEVRPPGKRLSHMGLLSGGEKALVAMALLFAIYLIKPSPFCLLDEVDAPLDEANIERFNDLLNEIKKYSQILLVTHNRRSMEIVDSLYGVTMEKAGVSKMVSVELQSRELH